jgi:hypothetical protein
LNSWPYDWNGFYDLTGSEFGTISNTYPLPMINAALLYPGLYGDYLYAGSPLGGNMIGGGETLGLPSVAVSCLDSPDNPNLRVGAYTPGFASAYNYGGNNEPSYSIDAAHGGPSSGPINGSVTGDLSGQLFCYFKVYWYGSGPPSSYATFLVSIDADAQANAYYPPSPWYSPCTTGLSATATAIVAGSGFSDTYFASDGDGALPDVRPPTTLHVMRAPVDPVTHIAKVAVNATTHWVISNSVPYQTFGAATASGGSTVQAGAESDTRDVAIVGGRLTSKKLLIGGVDANGDGLWSRVPNQFDANGTLSDDIAIPLGEERDVVIDYQSKTVDTTTKIEATYSPALSGNWATEGAQYLENSSVNNYNLQGSLGDPLSDTPPTADDIPKITNTFKGPTVDDTNNGAITWNAAGTTDHLFFKFTNGDNRRMYPTAYPTGTDGDGAIASANYYLHIHRPFESFLSHRPADIVCRIATAYPAAGIDPQTGQMDIPMTIDSPYFATHGYATNGSNGIPVNIELNCPSVAWDQSVNALAGIGDLPFPGELAILDQIFTGASLLVNYNKPHSDTHPIAFSDGAWNDPWSWGQGSGLQNDYHMFPRIRVRYTRTYMLIDTYNMSGFITETMTYSDKFLDDDSSFGYFQYIGLVPQP